VLTGELLARTRKIRRRLAGRMRALPDARALAARLATLDARTLKVLVETGPWITTEVSGPEIDVRRAAAAAAAARLRRDRLRVCARVAAAANAPRRQPSAPAQ
jgi:hypothetical protein